MLRGGLDSPLRRVDWRFLLKDPHPLRSVCFTRGKLSESVTLISKETVTPDQTIPGSCDLAVVSNPTGQLLKKAWDALRPGGMLYGEWYTALGGGSPRIRRMLGAEGFEEIVSYWAWPWPGRGSPLFWLPLEAPETLDYFMRSRPPSKTVKEGIFRSFMRLAWKFSYRARLLAPVCVTASKQESQIKPSRQKDGDLRRAILEGWESWGLGTPPESIHWLMLTGGMRDINKVVKLAFPTSDTAPRLVVKLARVPETIPSLSREARNLRLLEEQTGERLENVPRLLMLHHLGDSLALVETILAGHPMYALVTKENYRSFALNATEWLCRLVKPESAVPRSDWWSRTAEPVLIAFERKYGQELGRDFARKIRENLLQLESLPVAFEHRDFSPWNVMVMGDGEFSVLDWDDAEPNGLPGLDLIFFLTTLAFLHEGAMSTGRLGPAYRKAQDPASFTGAVQAECLQVYFERLGLALEFSRPLRLMAWAFHSLAMLPRIGSQEEPLEINRENPFIQLLLEDFRGDGSLPGGV